VLALATGVFEFTLHKLEEKLHRHRAYIQFLRRVYKELCLLGFMAFILILVRDYVPNLSKNNFLIIEFAHLLLFFVGICFILQSISILWTVRSSKERWDNAFAYGLTGLEKEYTELEDSNWFMSFIYYFTKRNYALQKARLFILRKTFIERNALPLTFDFSKYLRKCLTKHILEDIDIGWVTWLSLCLCFLVGFGISRGLNPEPDYLDMEMAMIAMLTMSWSMVIIALILWGAIEWGLKRFLNRSGCEKNQHLDKVLSFIKQDCPAEISTDIPRPRFESGVGLSGSDSERLDRILKQSMDTRNVVRLTDHDFSSIVSYREKGILPLSHPLIFLNIFRFLMLLQCYIFALTILLWIGLANTGYDRSWVTGLSISMEVIGHSFLMLVLFPRIARDFSVLKSVCYINDATVDVMEDILVYQQQTYRSIFMLGTIFHECFMENLEQFDGDKKVCAEYVFSLITPKGAERVSRNDLQKMLRKSPFRFRFKLNRITQVYRALNCQKGLGFERFYFLIQGMIRLKRLRVLKGEQLDKRFGSGRVKCNLCNEMVVATGLKAHIPSCAVQLPNWEAESDFNCPESFGLLSI